MADKHAEAYADTTPLTSGKNGELPPTYNTPGIAMVTVAPQSVIYPPPDGPPPRDYLVMSILTLVFCFWPLSLVALIKSIEVSSSIRRGDYASAHAASRDAHRFNKLSIWIGTTILVVTLILVALCQLAWIIPIAISHSKYN